MPNFEDIKNLWQNTKPEKNLPDSSEIISKVEKIRKKIMKKNIITITTLCLTFIFIVWIAFAYDFEFATTKAGLIIVLLTILLGIAFSIICIRLLSKKVDITKDTNTYLQQLITFRSKQRLIQTKGLTVYFILLTLGLTLYEIEFAVRDLKFGIIYYSLTLAWLAFVWFFLRKKTIAKQEKQINGQIELLENMTRNLQS